jgi:hypothetical protein
MLSGARDSLCPDDDDNDVRSSDLVRPVHVKPGRVYLPRRQARISERFYQQMSVSGRVYLVGVFISKVQSATAALSHANRVGKRRACPFHQEDPRSGCAGLSCVRHDLRKTRMRLMILLLALLGGLVLVGMLVAPYQPGLRSWYLQNACPYLDQLSQDICAAARREAGEGGTQSSTSGESPR